MSQHKKRLVDLSVSEKRALLAQVLRKQGDTSRSYPLSYAQERLWFLDQWEPQNAASNIFLTLQLQGNLRIQVLGQSLNEIVRRHQILRTVFLTIENQPAQVILPKMALALPLVDLEGLSTEEQDQQILSLIGEEARHPFDLRRGPLLRTMLLRVNAAEHIFFLSMHHIISDGWSMGIFFRELIELHEAFSQGQPSPLPDLPIQYADYALWQRQRLQGEVLQQHLEYWCKQLQGAPAVLALPTDRPRPPVQTFAGAVYRHILPAELNIALRALSLREGVTLFATLLAAFQVLLSRYSRQEDICVGTYIAGRTQLEVESLIGFFINNLVLRTDLSGDPSFRVLLQRVSKVTQEAYTHQEVPFEQLIQELQPERDPSHTPLFQVMLIYQNMPEYEPSLPKLTMKQLGTERTRANFDLSLWVVEWSEEKLRISFEYNTDLFDAATIQRLAERFQTLLQAIVVNPEQHISALPLLSTTELHQVLYAWNATTTPFAPDTSLDQLFAAQAARTPDTIAVVFEEQLLTYDELAHRAEQLAYVLQRQGVGQEVLVGLYLERSLEMIIAVLAVLQAGGAYVPMDPSYPMERLAFIVQQTRMPLLLTQSHLMERLSSLAVSSCWCLDTDWSGRELTSQLVQHRNNAGQMAYIIYTSGSTGEPKGVVVEHHSLINFTQAAARLFAMGPGERVLQFASLSFDASAEEIFPCLTHGGTLLLRNETMLQSPQHFVHTCQRWGVTVLDLPTAYWHELAATEALMVPCALRLVIIGGEQARAEPLVQWQRYVSPQVTLLNTYGPTETTVVASAHEVRPPERRGAFEAAMIGRPIANVQLYVLDQQGQPLPSGIPGELYIRGEGLARGYLGRPALTAERFVPHPFSDRPGERLYRTGDLVRWQPDGSLEYRGRVDRQVKLRGFRIELGEIEVALVQHPAVREAVVLLREDVPGDKRLIAYVTGQPAQPFNSGELRSFLQQRLPSYMLPTTFVQLEKMPQIPNGKLDHRALLASQTTSREREWVWEFPQTPTEELLADLWKQVLHLEQVGRYDHFFGLGGHSLLATQLVARVRELFKIELPLRTIFEAPTLAAQAKEIEIVRNDQQPLQMPPLQSRTPQEELPLSYAQQRLWFLHQLQPESPSYNIPLTIRFTGTLDIATLHGSLLEVMRRQEILRTTFITREGRPQQIIASQPAICLPVVDLSELAEQEQGQVLALLAQQEAQQPFDLSQGPLLRTTLLRLAHKMQIVLLTMHHIITDAWSMGVFFRELTELYRARVNRVSSSLPALAIQYADYALWQRHWLEGSGEKASGVQEQQLAYWHAQLASAPPLLELPTDHPRPQEQSYRGARFAFALPSDLVACLRQLGQQEGATLFMVLLAGFGGLLARYSGQDDLVVGTPIANRRHTQLEGLIGFFVNTLALRLSLSDHPTVREMLRRTREVALGAYAHQDLPFERVVEALHPQRNLSHTPLFQVVFAWQNAASASLELPEVSVNLLGIENGIARFDLTLTMQEDGQKIFGVLEYNRDLFERETIQRMAGHLCTLLEGMVAHPERPMETLPLLSEAEQHQILIEWSATEQTYSGDQSLIQIFEEQAERTSESIALVFEELQLTYNELNRRANQLAHYLRQSGVKAEKLVGLCLERSVEMVIGILGILKANGAYVPLDPSLPTERLAFILQDTQIAVLLSQQALLPRLPTLSQPVLCLDRDWSAIASQPTCNLQLSLHPDTLAYVIYTSGSTGSPKGVLVCHRHVSRLLACTQDRFHFDQHDRWTLFHSITFDFSVWELWGALLSGGRLLIISFWLSREPERFFGLLVREQITVLNQTPSAFRQLVPIAISPANTNAALALRLVILGGEALDLASVRSWLAHFGEYRTQLVNMYGITETTVHVTWLPLTQQMVSGELVGPIGRPLPDLCVYLLDRTGQLVPVGVSGEIYVGGAGVARGYLQRPELTAERFVPHPFSSQPGARLYRSGDLACYTAEGQLEYLGRSDAQVKLRGFRIELGEIEAVLRSHEAVREAVVALHEETGGEKRLIAYLVAHSDEPEVPLAAIRRSLAQRLPDYMIPAVFIPLDALPLTPNGKLDHRALPAPDGNRPDLNKEYIAPRTEVERTLTQIWSQVLRIEQVGIHDNFFELGGDSILSIQVVARAHAAGLPLTPRHLFQHQTIAQLATIVSSTVMQPTKAEVVEGTMPPMPIHHWFFSQDLPEPHHWNLAIMLQIRPELDPAVFEQALYALLMHHDALRLRAHHQPGGWQLCYAEPYTHVPLIQVDLSRVPQAEQRGTLEAAAAALQASLDLSNGPILRVALFELGAGQPGRLLIVIHHLAIDIVSWSILLEDLQTAYQQLQQGQLVRLPPKTTSVQQWARRLQDYAQTTIVREQLSSWLGQAWDQVRPLPLDFPANPEANREDSARSLVVALPAAETRALLSEVPKAYHTQINDVLLTALVQAFARWTGQLSLLVHLEGHGREDFFEDVDLSRTVGWFTSLSPLVLTLSQDEGPGERLKRIKEQLRAVPQGGIGFGLLRYLSQDAATREQLAALPRPEVSFNYGGRIGSALSPEGLLVPASEVTGAIHSAQGLRPHLLEINGVILNGQFYVQWTYSDHLHQHSTIEQLAQHYLKALQELITHCQLPDVGGYTPSDFPDARLTQAALDTLLTILRNTSHEDSLAYPRIEAIYPLSPMQEGMLFHSLYAPQSPAYFEQVAYTLREPLDGSAFRSAWQQVLDQHPILRTLFVWEQVERPLQVVRSHVTLPYQEHDWRHLPPQEQSARLQQWLQADRAQGFDLAHAPLLRLTVHRLPQQRVHVTWSFHHLLLDGWSVSTILGEVFACYRARLQGRPLTLATRRPYRDYIAWLQQQDFSQAERFWRQTLHGFDSPTPLGIDWPGHSQPESSYDYHEYSFLFSATVTADLQHLARQHQLTLNTLLQGAWALLLSRYSGQDDVVFGTTVSGRPAALAGVEAMVGLFINTLPVRAQVRLEQRLLPWLQQLQAQQADARQYEYSHLVQIQGWSQVSRGQSLFESLLVFENYPISASSAQAQERQLTIESVEAIEQTNYPLTITVIPHSRMLIRLGYQGSRFEASAIERLAGHLQTLLEGMIADPDQRLGDLPILTAYERQQLLVEWNAAPPVAASALCLHQIFEQQAEVTPDAIAIVCEEEQLTYGELNVRANQVAHASRQLGVRPEVLVGVCFERSVAMVIAILSILKAGGAYVPLDPDSPMERLAFLLYDCQATALLSQQSLLERLPALDLPVLCPDRDWHTIASHPASNLPTMSHPDQLAYVIYTSGSTGQPKGVLVCHRQVARLFSCTQPLFHFTQHDRWTLFHSLAFDFSVWELFGALLFGARLIVVPFWQSREPERFFDLLIREQITVLNQTPSAFRQLVPAALAATDRRSALALRLVLFGGEALDLASVRSWFARFGESCPQLVNLYGITETTVHVTCQPLTQELVSGEQLSPIGRPLPDLQLYLLDRAGQSVPIGVTGEIYVGGAGVTRGYLHRSELTATRFVPHPFSAQPGARLYRSGDLARYTAEGQLEYLGRNDAQVKLRGFRIELGEIEAVLRSHEAVGEAVVALHEETRGEKRLVAYLVPASAQASSLAELRAFLSSRLPTHMLPAAFVPLEKLPLTSNGKLDRGALPAPDGTRPEMDKEYLAPHTEVERTLAQIWSQVLRLQQVGVQDNFFELGGDSILSIQIVARAHAAGLPLTPRHLFQYPTIAQLAAVVGSATMVRTEAEVVEGTMPLMPIHCWFFAQHLAQPQHWNQAVLLQTRQKLEPAVLAQALQALLLQHDALRLRAQQQPEDWQLCFAAPDKPLPLLQVDLSGLPVGQQQATLEAAARALQASLNLTDGPILRVALFELGAGQPGRLLIVIHHLAIDIVSWSILLDDLLVVYQQLQRDQFPRLPAKTTSFQQWARRLQEYAQAATIREQLSSWLGQAWQQIHPLPVDLPADQEANREDSARSLVAALSAKETLALLSEVPKAYHTQINDVLLAALVQAFARWTGHASLLVHLEGHGREDLFADVDLSRTIGWFTSLVPLVLSLPESREPGAALMHIKEQLRAIPQGGIGFGLLRYLSQDAAIRERLATLPQPEVSFNYAGRSTSARDEEEFFGPAREAAGPGQGPQNQRPHILEINGSIVEDQLYIIWTYSTRLHQRATIERLAQSYIEALQALIEHCQLPDAGGYTPSDFPLAKLDEQKLRELSLLINSADEP